MKNNKVEFLKDILCSTLIISRCPNASKKHIKSMTNFIAYADGKHDLIWIADHIHVPASELYEIKNKLMEHDLLETVLEDENE